MIFKIIALIIITLLLIFDYVLVVIAHGEKERADKMYKKWKTESFVKTNWTNDETGRIVQRSINDEREKYKNTARSNSIVPKCAKGVANGTAIMSQRTRHRQKGASK